ncbi:MAG: DUF418 domain-containing protein [Sphingomicrobium sp.]
MTNQGVSPGRDRIEVIDALRGFALMGILIVNIRAWAGWFSLEAAERHALAGGPAGTWWFEFLVSAALEGKFYTIFSFLFGLGFTLQLARLEKRGLQGVAIYRRRLVVLLTIGIVHMSLLWDGDILALYALLGMLLPLFRGWSDRRLLGAATLLILLPIPGLALVHALGVKPDLGLPDVGNAIFVAFGGDVAQEKQWLSREDWRSYLAWHLSGPPFRIGGFFETWRIPKVLAIMLIGMWAGRRLVEGRLVGDRALLRRVAIAGFAIGIPANIGYGFTGGLEQEVYDKVLAATVLYAVGVVPLGLAYAATFALFLPGRERFQSLFAAPGRMALTNYLTHTLLGIGIFYGVGLGYYKSVSPWVVTLIALAIFCAQIAFSSIWLRHFAQGPVEALWRRLTYGKDTLTTRDRPR